MKKAVLLFCFYWGIAAAVFAQIPPDWDSRPPQDSAAFKYSVGVSQPAATEQEAYKGAWQNALQQFAESIATSFQGRTDISSQSASYSSDIEDEFTVVVSSSSFSTKVKLAGAREAARKIGQENGKYIARVLAILSAEDYAAARQYAANDEAAALAYRFFARCAAGIAPLDRQGKPQGFDDYYSWLRNACVILSFAESAGNAGAFLEQLELFVKKLYKNAALFAETIDGTGVRIVYDAPRYYDGISRALQNLSLFGITKQDARLSLSPLKTSALADFRAAVSALKDSSKVVITGIETIQTENGQAVNQGNIVLNQFKAIASRDFGLAAVNFTIPASYTAGFVDEDGIISYVKRNFAAFPARFLVLCYAETRLSAAIPEYKVPPLVTASCRFMVYDTVTGEITQSGTADTAGSVFSPANMQDQTVIAESRRALHYLFNAKNRGGLADIMKETLGKL
ncbi:MAG: hypothetical protein LBD37_06265 [Treponema sp.]|jgi:hypothetical protein|nr:hypothetical protein [Treponema sp.]